tara:strand:- start:313 stop:483 length:171 start_codon:yes stop_codon:yes gene_type:complete
MKRIIETPQERLRSWEEMPQPRPTWESFKRLLASCGNDETLARKKWKKKLDIMLKD